MRRKRVFQLTRHHEGNFQVTSPRDDDQYENAARILEQKREGARRSKMNYLILSKKTARAIDYVARPNASEFSALPSEVVAVTTSAPAAAAFAQRETAGDDATWKWQSARRNGAFKTRRKGLFAISARHSSLLGQLEANRRAAEENRNQVARATAHVRPTVTQVEPQSSQNGH